MKKFAKRILIGVLVAALVVGLAAGGIYWKTSQKGTVNVYSVSELAMTDYWGDSNESYGSVTMDKTQTVYLSTTQTVDEVLVVEGQAVSKGDVLMTYDTTLSEVEVEKQELAVQQLELDLEEAKAKLEKVKKYKAGVSISEEDQVDVGAVDSLSGISLTAEGWRSLGTAVVSFLGGRISAKSLSAAVSGEDEIETPEETTTEEETTEEESTTEKAAIPEETTTASEETTMAVEETTTDAEETTRADETSSEETTEAESSTEETSEEETTEENNYPELESGSGKKKSPYIYTWNDSCEFTQDFLAYLGQGKRTAYVKLQVEENGEVTAYWLMKITRSGGVYSFEMLELCVDGMVCDLTNLEPETEEPDDDYIDDDYGYYGGDYYGGSSGISYTASEIAEMRNALEEEIRDLDLEIRTEKVELEKLRKELDSGSVVSEIDGIVSAVRDEDESKINNEAFISISGGGGYYVEGSVSELEIDALYVGKAVNLVSLNTGLSYVGEVVEISNYPASNSYYYGSGNTNVSLYSYKVFLDESAELQEDDYMEISYETDTEGGDNFYLTNFMLRTENGSSYVYVRGEDGKLEKRTIRTGKMVWSYYTEILSGLSLEDQIAFPYGSSLKEGADTQEASTDSLYSY